ncbi:hypothetical protein BC937DRAFT_88810 [Endogone sp. FLAS-F59071]|nr:hypothetical protein BC937DRAFT_88810 [Endogone sp. FLAS-F59071]|eukprot:RUS22482.1 hypothetical protein BC937DRAFT_88810 [Endogone sp. FLAS-F59071]
MTLLASFQLSSRNIFRPKFVVESWNTYENLHEFMPKEVFDMRVTELQGIAKQGYRTISLLENLSFITVPIALILMAIYALAGKVMQINGWYWSAFVFIPVIATIIISARAASVRKIWLVKWEATLSITVKNLTMNDASSLGVLWTWRKKRYGGSFNYFIDITQADVEVDVDVLPAYNDALLEASPPPHPELPLYDDLQEFEMTNMTRLGPRPLDEVTATEITHTAESEEVDLAEVRGDPPVT